MQIDKQLAEALRKEGFTYPEIAFRLGCSKAWCAKHLSNIPKGSSDPSKLSVNELQSKTIEILEKAMLDIRQLS